MGGERVQVEFRKKKARKETWKSVFEETGEFGPYARQVGMVGETMARGPGHNQKKLICPQLAPPNPLRFNCFTERIPGSRITARLVVESVASTDYCYLATDVFTHVHPKFTLEQHFPFS
jgi:hypothetical protein